MGMQERKITAPNGVETTVLVNDEDVEQFDADQKDAEAARKAADDARVVAAGEKQSGAQTKARKTADNK